MIGNALDMLFSRSRKTLTDFFQGWGPSEVTLRDAKPDMFWGDASVGIFICGVGRALYVHPGASPAVLQRRYKLDGDRGG